ncbi:MAG TPA: DNA-protecting protein DprA [Firmicutes bacterium]|nr:DNA-protecting protein DprA [Bacillota bacterium]
MSGEGKRTENLTERDLWLAVAGTPGVGARSFFELLELFGHLAAFWEASETEVRERAAPLGARRVQALLMTRRRFKLEEALKRLEQAGVQFVTLLDAAYPDNLKTIFDPPPVLYYRGDLRAGDSLAVAMVGSRRATPYGREIATKFARELAGAGVTVVSGLARGIDSAAHRGALAGGGRTLAVLGSGLDVIYPPENARLYAQVAEHGAVLSEFPLGARPEAGHFPMRNRVISGLARAVVVVEAARTSGSLITADCALEQGRDVFAVPGPVTSPFSWGTNNLLKQGAKVMQDVSDVLVELGLNEAPATGCERPDLTSQEEKVYSLFSERSLHIDELVRRSGLTAQEVTAILMMLELKGLVRQLPGKMFFRVP